MQDLKIYGISVSGITFSFLPDINPILQTVVLILTIVYTIIGGSDMSEADKKIALKKLDIERAEIDGTTRRWVADATSGSWLAANVRPLTLVFLVVSYVAGWYMGYPLDSITGLLTIVIGGYFGSRGVEKVFGNSKHK